MRISNAFSGLILSNMGASSVDILATGLLNY